MIGIHAHGEDPYGSLVSNFFTSEFPQANIGNSEATLEYLTQAFVATHQVRYGPAPSPESLVAIRSVLRSSIEKNHPIPILMPYGSRKSRLGERLDVAEVTSLRTLACLQNRVIQRYSPGIQINMRIEDTSGNYLFRDEGMISRDDTYTYVLSLTKLISILGYRTFISPIPESSLYDEKDLFDLSDRLSLLLYNYIVDTDAVGLDGYSKLGSWKALEEQGWRGPILPEQREFYRGRYRVNYPGITQHDATMKLAQYLGSSRARRILNPSYGADPSWGDDYIKLTFANPVPGAPMGMVDKTLYYRILPTSYASTHIAPWRAKGYLRIQQDVTPKLASWNEPKEYSPLQMEFSDTSESVMVQSDYVLESTF